MPTTVNNVETFALAAAILAKGVDWFKSIGHAEIDRAENAQHLGRRGRGPGVYEIPMGTTIQGRAQGVAERTPRPWSSGRRRRATAIRRPSSPAPVSYEDVADGRIIGR